MAPTDSLWKTNPLEDFPAACQGVPYFHSTPHPVGPA